MLEKNIDQSGRIIRLISAVIILIIAFLWKSWILFGISLFIFFEVLMSWCILYQILGKKSCNLKKK